MPQSGSGTGPMRTQPDYRASVMPTPMQPAMPVAGKNAGAAEPKQEPPRGDVVRAAKARISRLNSLRKQRDALKDAT